MYILEFLFLYFFAFLDRFVANEKQIVWVAAGYVVFRILLSLALSPASADPLYIIFVSLLFAPFVYFYMLMLYRLGDRTFLWLLMLFVGGFLINLVGIFMIATVLGILGIHPNL